MQADLQEAVVSVGPVFLLFMHRTMSISLFKHDTRWAKKKKKKYCRYGLTSMKCHKIIDDCRYVTLWPLLPEMTIASSCIALHCFIWSCYHRERARSLTYCGQTLVPSSDINIVSACYQGAGFPFVPVKVVVLALPTRLVLWDPLCFVNAFLSHLGLRHLSLDYSSDAFICESLLKFLNRPRRERVEYTMYKLK